MGEKVEPDTIDYIKLAETPGAVTAALNPPIINVIERDDNHILVGTLPPPDNEANPKP